MCKFDIYMVLFLFLFIVDDVKNELVNLDFVKIIVLIYKGND